MASQKTCPSPNVNRDRGQKGAAAVEMALVVPLLMLILFGVVDAATALYDYAAINHASRVGARWGTIPTNNPTGTAWSCTTTATGNTNPCQVSNTAISGLLISYQATSSPSTTASGGGTPGSSLTVTTSYTFKGTFTGAFLTLPISATSIMNNE